MEYLCPTCRLKKRRIGFGFAKHNANAKYLLELWHSVIPGNKFIRERIHPDVKHGHSGWKLEVGELCYEELRKLSPIVEDL